MRPPVDLHIHSTFSDGTYAVNEIVAQAIARGMQTIALSDHDTADGLVPLANALETSAYTGHILRFIPAIEMSSGETGLAHILGYGVQANAQPLRDELVALRRKRAERTRETVRLLKRLIGFEVSAGFLEQVEKHDHVTGRVHVARMLVEKQLVYSIDEAFSKYLAEGRPAFVPLKHITSEQAIDTLLHSQAVPVLAHPMRSGLKGEELERYIIRLRDAGLKGIEVFHPSASVAETKWLYALARKLSLLVTGGSDFHGEWSLRNKIGEYPPGWQTWQEDIVALQAAINDSDA